MTHTEIEEREIIENYVRNRLTTEERRAFQDHFFSCDQCFEQVEMTERFIAGVRYAAEKGLIAPATNAAGIGSWAAWIRFAWPATAAACLVFAILSGWLFLYQLPRLRGELANERQAREQTAQAEQEKLRRSEEQLRAEREARSTLERTLAQKQDAARTVKETDSSTTGNIALFMLSATRNAAESDDELVVPAGANSFVLWAEVDPSARFDTFRLEIFITGGQALQTVGGLTRNRYGAVAVSVPAAPFSGGKYLAKLYGVSQQRSALVGEYNLRIRRR